jgi:hypothetical protein
MTDLEKDPAVVEIVASLTQRASELWGPGRASNLEAFIAQAAVDIRRIELDPPPDDEEPQFHI